MNRRNYLAIALTVGLTGCVGSGDDDSSGNTTDPDNERTEQSDTENGDEGEDERTEPENGGEEGQEGKEEESEDDEEGEDDEEDDSESPETLDDFEDLSKWDVLAGSLSADTDRSTIGTQSAFLEASESDRRVRIAREFATPQDISDGIPGIAIAGDDLVIPRIRLFDESGDRVDFRRGAKGDMPFMRYNFGVEEIVGDPDLSAVTEVYIDLFAGDQARHFWCDDLHLTPRPETGKVMIQFDDGHDTDYTRGLEVLEEYDYPAVSFINPGRVGATERLDLDQLEALKDAGWTIANHTLSHPHLTELDESEREAEIRDGKEWLIEHGFERGANYFAYPFGDFDERTIELVDQHHELGFAGGYPVQGYNTNPLLASRMGDPDPVRARRVLDQTATMGAITCLFYHRLEGELLSDFTETMSYLHELESAGELDIILPEDLESDLQF